nr:hypothetical protein [Tanacetum cinerariifolium]
MKKSGSNKNPIIEESPKRFTRGKKEGENIKKAEEEAQVESEEDVLYERSNSHNERLPVGENNESEEEEEVRKLIKAKMEKGLESESEGEEQLKKVTKPKRATRQKVHNMLGIPMGSKKLEDMEQRPSHDPYIKEWEEQFKHVQKPTPAAIASVISHTTEADLMFQMNFITLFESTMGTLDNGGRVSTKLLKRITEDVDISDIDWCGPALRSWNTATRKKRIKMETETRCLGKLKHHGEFDPEEEHDRMNVYKGLDVYVPPINDKEPEKRSELVRTLRNGVKKFEDNHIMIDFCKQYGGLFNDNEFNLYESSKDDDSEEESGSEGTEESGSEGTKVNGSEGTEGGSDGKEEKINGDDREVTVQMDVDNQNGEINKQKDANETEDNDNMNNNEMKNDLVQEKQDADKDENAEKEKVKMEKESRIKLIKLTMFRRNKTMIRKKLLRMNFGIHRLLTHVFNFLKGTTVIIDNSKTPMAYEAKYKEVCDVLENNTDCGVFLMMHVENYNRETARNWSLKLLTEEKGNKYDIIKMRMRFDAKMLTHEINIHHEKISKEALEVADCDKEKKAMEALLLKAIRVKKQKQNSERVENPFGVALSLAVT